MTRWSGIAAAVNAHLHRWSQVSGETERLLALAGKGEEPRRVTFDRAKYPVVGAWAQFAKTWGVPDQDGVIHHRVISEGMTVNGREQFDHDELSAGMGFQLMRRENEMLFKAMSVYVAGAVVEKVAEWAVSMEPEPLFETDLFCPNGCAVFEHPVYVPDLHPETGAPTDYLRVAVRAIGWCPEPDIGRTGHPEDTGPGVMLFIYTTRDDWNASYKADVLAALRRGDLSLEDVLHEDPAITGVTIDDFARLVQPPRWTDRIKHDDLFISDVIPWRFATPWEIGEVEVTRDGVVDSTVAYVRRWFLTLMRFTWQRIFIQHRPELTKKQARLMMALNMPQRDYTVLRLRRPVEGPTRGEETGTGRKLMYRQLRSEHWKRQHYPSLGPARNEDGSFNHDSHRLIKIGEYWAGPEDAPIGPLHHAASVVR